MDDEIDINNIAKRTQNYTGADIAAVCNEARMLAIREFISQNAKDEIITKELIENAKIKLKHFEAALKQVKTISKELLDKYTAMAKEFSKF